MAETRPSGQPVVAGNDTNVIQEVAEIDVRGRLRLLPRWLKRVDWLRPRTKKDIDALMILVEPGLISLRDWRIDGPRIMQRYAEMANKPDAGALDVLRLIQDRYQRLVITEECRPYLGDAALAHLGLPIGRGTKSVVYVAVFPDRIDVLSPAFRDAKLILGDPRLDDLP